MLNKRTKTQKITLAKRVFKTALATVALGFVYGLGARTRTIASSSEETSLYMTPEQIDQLMSDGGGHMRWQTERGDVTMRIIDDSQSEEELKD